MQPESESTQSRNNATPAASTTPEPIGGMPLASRRLLRWIRTDRAASPGAISSAFAIPKLPD